MASTDSSSLEALLKAEPLEKRAPPELRGPEDDPGLAEFTGGGLNPAARVRKVQHHGPRPFVARGNLLVKAV